jgi:hypothetical protein
MKKICCVALLLGITLQAFAGKPDKFSKIDAYARGLGYYPLPELAQKLTAPYNDEESKVRSIFIWVATHISYDVEEYERLTSIPKAFHFVSVDSANSTPNYWHGKWAEDALKKKKAVCAGYSALFKMLCRNAGINCEVIEGDVRWSSEIGQPFSSNHAWNAVMINQQWKLMDVTWSSGYVNDNITQFKKKFTPRYYDIAPERMILDHYPDSVKWTLLPRLISRKQYEMRPYTASRTADSLIPISYYPANGVIKCKPGDSLRFELELPVDIESLTLEEESDSGKFWYYIPFIRENENKQRTGNATLAEADPVFKRQPEGYAQPLPAGRAKEKKPPAKAKISAAQEKTVDDILDYINSAEPAAAATLPTNQSVNMPEAINDAGQSEMTDTYKPLYFYKHGKKIKFYFVVKTSGFYNLSFFVQDEAVLIYAIQAE